MPTIKVKESTKERLKFFGKFGMTYDDVINDALDQLEDAIDDHFEKSDSDFKTRRARRTREEDEDDEDEYEDEDEDE